MHKNPSKLISTASPWFLCAYYYNKWLRVACLLQKNCWTARAESCDGLSSPSSRSFRWVSHWLVIFKTQLVSLPTTSLTLTSSSFTLPSPRFARVNICEYGSARVLPFPFSVSSFFFFYFSSYTLSSSTKSLFFFLLTPYFSCGPITILVAYDGSTIGDEKKSTGIFIKNWR